MMETNAQLILAMAQLDFVYTPLLTVTTIMHVQQILVAQIVEFAYTPTQFVMIAMFAH